jgi:TolA-binding protein
MQTVRAVRKSVMGAVLLAVVMFSAPKPAHAVSKEIIELQTQVSQLLDMMQRMQSTMDAKFGVLQNLAQQTADQANQMNAAVNKLDQRLNQQNEANTAKLDGVSGQMQSLNDSVDELKSRIAKLDKSVQEMQNQLQTMQQPAAPTGNQPGPNAPGPNNVPNGQGLNAAPPLQDTFQAGLRDFNAARYSLAAGEFQDVVHYYPLDDLAGTSDFYLGEIAYQQQNFQDAVNQYNAVLEGFSGNKMAPAAQLHKGMALMALNKRDAGIHELRTLIQRHPQTPEAQKARTKLNGMGVKITGK